MNAQHAACETSPEVAACLSSQATATKQESMIARRMERNAGAMRTNVSDLIAALMKRPSTRKQLREVTGISNQSIDSWLSALHSSGLIRLKGYVEKTTNAEDQLAPGQSARIWEFQATPFAVPDFERRSKPRAGEL